MQNILVIEDDHIMLKAMRNILNKGGYNIIIASNGKEAFELIDSSDYDIVVTDLMMPYANGLEVVSKVRKNPSKKHVGIIVVSSMGHEEMVTEAFSLGADDFLRKPIMAGELLSRIRKLLTNKSMYRNSAHIPVGAVVTDHELHVPVNMTSTKSHAQTFALLPPFDAAAENNPEKQSAISDAPDVIEADEQEEILIPKAAPHLRRLLFVPGGDAPAASGEATIEKQARKQAVLTHEPNGDITTQHIEAKAPAKVSYANETTAKVQISEEKEVLTTRENSLEEGVEERQENVIYQSNSKTGEQSKNINEKYIKNRSIKIYEKYYFNIIILMLVAGIIIIGICL